MMYLGEEAGKPYAIYAVSGVKDRDGNIMKIDKVAVNATSRTSVVLSRGFGEWLSVHPHRVAVAVALASIISVMVFVRAVAV